MWRGGMVMHQEPLALFHLLHYMETIMGNRHSSKDLLPLKLLSISKPKLNI